MKKLMLIVIAASSFAACKKESVEKPSAEPICFQTRAEFFAVWPGSSSCTIPYQNCAVRSCIVLFTDGTTENLTASTSNDEGVGLQELNISSTKIVQLMLTIRRTTRNEQSGVPIYTCGNNRTKKILLVINNIDYIVWSDPHDFGFFNRTVSKITVL